MKYSEVQKELKKEFDGFLKPLGYKTKSGSQGYAFLKANTNDYQKIGFGLSNYEPVYYTGVYSYVGVYSIDKILCESLEMEYVRTILGGGTISTSTSIYFQELNYQFKIQNTADIKQWMQLFEKYYTEHLLPFFNMYNTVEAIDKLLNENPTERVIHCDDLGWRIIKGLISAKLNQNPKYDELRAYYKSEVESKFQGYFMYEKCMKTINFLDNHSQEELLKIAENPA